MDKKRFEELCRLGEGADELMLRGRTTDALKRLEDLMKNLEDRGEMDSYLSAKITLSLLRCHLKSGNFKLAFAVWNADIEDSVHGVGILALESAQTTVRDMVIYDMMCAFLHTLADCQKADAASAVNQYLSRVCEQAFEEGDRLTMRLALNNWKQHLRDVFVNSIPHVHARDLIYFERLFGEAVKPQSIEFPLPAPWEKPGDFREMSYVADMREPAKPLPHPTFRKKPQAS
jgi:hypothetical protein